MTRTMHDAVTASNIPADAAMVAGYIDANFAWSAADWQRFPHATLVPITVYPWTNDGVVIDIEPGNWEPPDAPAWCRMRRQSGAIPTVYTMRSWWQWCIDEFDRQGEPQPQYWIADWDADATLPPGAVAKQYANGTMLGTGYDLNVVADYWPGVDNEEDDMPSAEEVAQAVWQYNIPSGHKSNPEWWAQSFLINMEDDQDVTQGLVRELHAGMQGLAAAVAALSDDSELTAERVEQIVRDAVQQSIEITGTVTVSGSEEQS